jgi:glycerol transport system ATP-binding protein
VKKERKEMVPIEGKVQLAEAVGSDTELHVDHQGHTMIVLMQDIVRYEPGQDVDLYINPYRFYVFDKGTRELCAKTIREEES